MKRKKILVRIAAASLAAVLLAGAVTMGLESIQERRRAELIERRGPVNIVVFGDSIWAMSRDESGIAARLEQELDQARVYDCSIMGTSAAYRLQSGQDTPEDIEAWNRKSLAGILSEPDGMNVVAAEAGITDVPLDEADYVIVAFGLNDYFCAVPRSSGDEYDEYTYEGALRSAVRRLRERYPDAGILLLSQTYCQGYSYGKVDSESDYKDYGGGTGPDYVASARRVAEDMGCIFVDNYKDLGINLGNGPKYLSDATHLTEYGREKYAENLANYLLEDYKGWVEP